MPVFPNLIIRKQCALVQVLYFGKSMQADLQFITHAIYVQVDYSRGFIGKFSAEKCDHGHENRGKRPAMFGPLFSLPVAGSFPHHLLVSQSENRGSAIGKFVGEKRPVIAPILLIVKFFVLLSQAKNLIVNSTRET